MDKRKIAHKKMSKRATYTVEQRILWDQKIHDDVIDRIGNHKVIALYAAFNHEVDTYGIIETLLWRDDITIVLPRVKGQSMDFYSIQNLTDLKPGVMGILEPTAEQPIEASAIDCIIVPMAAFNREGYRIGYGGGYYDRYLKNQSFIKIGVAYDFQETPEVFQEAHDIPCDVIITNQEVINVQE